MDLDFTRLARTVIVPKGQTAEEQQHKAAIQVAAVASNAIKSEASTVEDKNGAELQPRRRAKERVQDSSNVVVKVVEADVKSKDDVELRRRRRAKVPGQQMSEEEKAEIKRKTEEEKAEIKRKAEEEKAENERAREEEKAWIKEALFKRVDEVVHFWKDRSRAASSIVPKPIMIDVVGFWVSVGLGIGDEENEANAAYAQSIPSLDLEWAHARIKGAHSLEMQMIPSLLHAQENAHVIVVEPRNGDMQAADEKNRTSVELQQTFIDYLDSGIDIPAADLADAYSFLADLYVIARDWQSAIFYYEKSYKLAYNFIENVYIPPRLKKIAYCAHLDAIETTGDFSKAMVVCEELLTECR